jgi:ATP-dependent exoDNAse (exonuclease V) alpha subunit
MTFDTLNDEQQFAVNAIHKWILDRDDEDQFHLLVGSAGTGKTYCVRALADQLRGRLVFTAPTNKATKVLREGLTTKDYRPDCRTIYSLLGLKLEASGEVKTLTVPEDPIDLSQFRCVIVDEGSMINEQLRQYIHEAADSFNVKFLFLGDPAQLPPVGEIRSPIWRIKRRCDLTKVMRHDNEILALATELRGMVDHPAPRPRLTTASGDGETGVFALGARDLMARVELAADNGDFSRPNDSKVIAWRNVTVDRWNKIIRARIFPEATSPWLVGDRALFTSPAKDTDGKPMASTDDEGEITRIGEDWHPFYADYKIWRITLTLDDNRIVQAHVLHEDSARMHADRLSELSTMAKANGRMWRQFWDFKDSFHQIRHAYAITAHRAQGSTYRAAYVDYRDVMTNQTRSEMMRCLYVACTRPKEALYLG